MNHIDYWYKKYIALKECEKMLKPELTWQDIAKILSIYELEISSGNISRYGDASDLKPISERILVRFNELPKKGLQ